MTPRRIKKFFQVLAEEIDTPATIYLTGACAAALWGRVRPSQDVDFGMELPADADKTWEDVHAAVVRTSRRLGIAASVAADIDRWGMITLLDYKRTSRRCFRAGPLDVRLLAPTHWSIGKLTRFLDPDVRDVARVFHHLKVPAQSAAKVWGRALRASPPSTTQFQFRRNVEGFFNREGKRIWGKDFDPAAAIRWFHRAAEIKTTG